MSIKAIALLMSFLVLSYSNCSKVQVSDNPVSSDDNNNLSDNPPDSNDPTNPTDPTTPINPQDPIQVYKNCADAKAAGKMLSATSTIQFENTGRTCDWGVNGNLTEENSYVRARREIYKSVALPTNAKVCQVKMSHAQNASFRYDDNILITMNGVLLASTTHFQDHFPASNGLHYYSWANLINKPALYDPWDSTPDLQYCLGKAEGLSACNFPVTDTVGTIKLDFGDKPIQTVLAATTQSKVNLGWIITGDNDTSDCQATTANFNLTVEYYK